MEDLLGLRMVLLETDQIKVVVAGLEAGRKIPLHPESQGVYHFLEGTGWMIVDGERLPVGPGATVLVPPGSTRGIEAETRLAFLAVRVA
jgi:mannose-6-phosphate isomerase-like protein (cupin superfamily)